MDVTGRIVSRRTVLQAAALALGSAAVPRAAWGVLPGLAGPAPDEGERGATAPGAGIERYLAEAHIPGLAAAVVQGDRVLWSAGFGAADLGHGTPATSDTLFLLASVSKTVTGVAVMQLVEDSAIDLDADVNGYLPFPVRNPMAPDVPITARMLLTHTSSINDDPYLIGQLYFHGDPPIPLGEFLEGYLVPGGTYYTENSYLPFRPGEQWRYSNYAVALAGYLVEAVGPVSFDLHCHRHIFEPLGMAETGWHLRGLPRAELAMPYAYDVDTGEFDPYGHYGYPDYPDGLLRTSASQLARFLMAFIGDGQYRDARILEPSTVEEMRRVQFPRLAPWQGLIWYYDEDGQGRVLLGHNGGDLGVSTLMFYRPEDGVGVIVLTNGEAYPLRVQDRLLAWPNDVGPSTRPSPVPWRTRRPLAGHRVA